MSTPGHGGFALSEFVPEPMNLDERINSRGWSPHGTTALRSFSLAPRWLRAKLAAAMRDLQREHAEDMADAHWDEHVERGYS